jgi:hypothetical protein
VANRWGTVDPPTARLAAQAARLTAPRERLRDSATRSAVDPPEGPVVGDEREERAAVRKIFYPAP